MVAACKLFFFSSGMWDLVPRPRIKPRPLALGVGSLSHWTTWEVPVFSLISIKCEGKCLRGIKAYKRNKRLFFFNAKGMYLEKHKRLYKFTIVGDLSFHGSKLKLKGVMKIGLLNSISYKI